jgi:hypothetical protein
VPAGFGTGWRIGVAVPSQQTEVALKAKIAFQVVPGQVRVADLAQRYEIGGGRNRCGRPLMRGRASEASREGEDRETARQAIVERDF